MKGQPLLVSPGGIPEDQAGICATPLFSSSGFRVFLNSIFSLLASLVITARSKQGPNLAPFVQNNMVEAFCGKWQVDLSCTSGIEEYGAAMGK